MTRYRSHAASVLGLAASACFFAQSSDTVFGERRQYATLADARRAELFARGWLPDVLPEGSGPIAIAHDPESSARCGRAVFPREGRAALVVALLEFGFDAFVVELPVPRGCPFRAPAPGPTRRVFQNGEGEAQPAFVALGDDVLLFWVARPEADG